MLTILSPLSAPFRRTLVRRAMIPAFCQAHVVVRSHVPRTLPSHKTAKPVFHLAKLPMHVGAVRVISPLGGRCERGTVAEPQRKCDQDDARRAGEDLQAAINQTRVQVWRAPPAAFFDEAVIDADGTVADTTGQCKEGMKEGMDIAYTGACGAINRSTCRWPTRTNRCS